MSLLLIVEDNYDLIELYNLSFETIGITPEVIMTGAAALRRLEKETEPVPNAVLLDLHLKPENKVKVTGEDVFHVMRQKWPKTRIIVVSADILWCQKFRGVADEVVEKPILDMSDFLMMVKKHLTHR